MAEVSIIIPSYGRPTYLDRAIKSVLTQTFTDWELIIVDDNNPETETLMLNYSAYNNIKYLKHDKNKNGAAARNTGINIATGKYITFLDDDDEYLPKRLEKCVTVLNKKENGTYGGVYTGREFRRNGKTYYNHVNVRNGNYMVDTLKCTFMLCSGSNLFIRADIVRELGGFDESFLRHQDYEFLVRFFRKYDLIAIPEILTIKNQLNANTPNAEKMYKIKQHYWNKFQTDIEKLEPEVQKQVYFNGYLQLIEYAAKDGNIKGKKQYIQKSKEYGTIQVKNWVRIWAHSIIALFKGKVIKK